MKKTALFLATLLLSLATASAQWVRPVPEFSDIVVDGSTVQYLYNVEAGGFLLGANDWNTRATLSKEKGYKMVFLKRTDVSEPGVTISGYNIWTTISLLDSVETKRIWSEYDCQAYDQIWCDGAGRNKGEGEWVILKKDSVKTFTIRNAYIENGTIGTTGIYFGWAPYDGDSTNMRCFMLDYSQKNGNSIPLFDQKQACTTWAVVSVANYQAWQGKLETYVSAMTLGDYIAQSEATYEGINLAAPKAVYNNTSSTKAELDAALDQAREIVNEYRFGNVSGDGFDCTDLIVNPSFEEGTEGWAYNYMSLQSNESFTLKAGTNYMERWVSNGNYVGVGSVSQTLTNLPSGVYRLTAAAQNIQQNQLTANQTGAWLFAGDERTAVTVTDTYSVVFNHVSGDVTIGFEATDATGNWIAVDNFTLTYYGDSIILPSYIEKYNLAVEAAKAAIADEDNAGATDEIARLQALIDAEMPATSAEIDAAREVIEAATEDLISAGVVTNYERIMTAYPQDISSEVPGLAQWTGGMVSNTSQHWDGTSTSLYYEQTSEQWLQSAWTNSKSMSTIFPSGKYVICMAGRSASGNNVKAYLRVNDVEVVFPSKGDVGFGVDVNGVATLSPSATYANNGLGRGWEYRYVKFESDGKTPTYFTVGGEATAAHQWMSFTEPQFRTTADNDGSAVYATLTNADFMADEPETMGIHTYEKDITGTEDKAQNQPVTAWTINGFGDAHAAGTFQYGSTAFLGASGYYPPTAGPDGQQGQALGILAAWAATTQYTQNVMLPAGSHTMRVVLYNTSGTSAVAQNLIGVNGIYASRTTYPVGEWTTEQIDFTLDEEQAVTVSLGYQAGNSGSGSMPHLFIDRVSIDEEETPDTIPGEKESDLDITNASFELSAKGTPLTEELKASNGPLDIYGWTMDGVGTQYNNTEIRTAGSTSTTSQFGTSAPSEGEYSLFFRQGWNGSGNTITLTSAALGKIPAGTYQLSVDYKQHYSYDNTTSSNTYVGIALVNGEATVASAKSESAEGGQGSSADVTYFNDTEWSTLSAPFTLSEDLAAGSSVVITLNAGGQRRSDFFIDNVKLAQISEDELIAAAKEEALQTIATLPIDILFGYNQTDIQSSQQSIEEANNTETIKAILQSLYASQILPKAEQPYLIKNAAADLSLHIKTGGVGISANHNPVFFTSVEDGFYVLSDKYGEYIYKTTSNTWTLSTTTELIDAYRLQFNIVEGGYTIQGANGLLGTDGIQNASIVYANKTAGNNTVWTIEEYTETPNPYSPIAGAGVNTVDLSSMGIDWRNISDEAFAAVMQQIDWANVEALTIPENSTERITPYLSKAVSPKLRDVVVLEPTLPVEEMQKVDYGANVMVRMPEGTTPIDASGNIVAAPDNVFIGGKAERVVLTDRTPYVTGYSYKGGNYFANQIVYTRTFGKSTRIGQSGGWEALVVPFNVAQITAADGRTLAPFGSTAQADANFWLAELTEDGFQPATRIEAGQPYIIAMPNSAEYDAQYNVTGDVTFSATNDSLYISQHVLTQSDNEMVFTPSYYDIAQTDAADMFTLNDETYQTYLPGGAFIRGLRAVRPFEAYVRQTSRSKPRRVLPIVLPEPTALYQIAAEGAQKTDGVIYDLTGRRVKAPTHGLYIRDGKKILVK